jgi:hypothetical protein
MLLQAFYEGFSNIGSERFKKCLGSGKLFRTGMRRHDLGDGGILTRLGGIEHGNNGVSPTGVQTKRNRCVHHAGQGPDLPD